MEQEHFESHTPNRKSWLYVCLAVIFSSVVVGGSVYTIERNHNATEKKDLQAQIDTLKSQLAFSTTTTPTPLPIVTASPTATSSPTPDPMAGWKTYTNTVSGDSYTFKYPSTLAVYGDNNVLATESSPSITIADPTQLNANDGAGSYLNLSIGAQNNPMTTPSNVIAYLEKKLGVAADVISETPTAYTIGGLSGFKSHTLIGSGAGEDVYVVSHPTDSTGGADIFFFDAINLGASTKSAVVQQILSSFAFTK